MANHKQWWIIAVVAGMLLIAASFIWTGGRRDWTDAQAQNYSEAAADLHRLAYEAAQTQELAKSSASSETAQRMLAQGRSRLPADAAMPMDPNTATPDRALAALATAKKRYDEARAQLDLARSQSGNSALILRWLGIGLVAAGLFNWVASGRKRKGRSD